MNQYTQHGHILKCVYIHTHMCLCVCVYIYIHTLTHVYIYRYTCIHTHTDWKKYTKIFTVNGETTENFYILHVSLFSKSSTLFVNYF